MDAPIDELIEVGLRDGHAADARSSCSGTSSTTRRSVVVETGDDLVGVITKIDLIEFLAERRA